MLTRRIPLYEHTPQTLQSLQHTAVVNKTAVTMLVFGPTFSSLSDEYLVVLPCGFIVRLPDTHDAEHRSLCLFYIRGSSFVKCRSSLLCILILFSEDFIYLERAGEEAEGKGKRISSRLSAERGA